MIVIDTEPTIPRPADRTSTALQQHQAIYSRLIEAVLLLRPMSPGRLAPPLTHPVRIVATPLSMLVGCACPALRSQLAGSILADTMKVSKELLGTTPATSFHGSIVTLHNQPGSAALLLSDCNAGERTPGDAFSDPTALRHEDGTTSSRRCRWGDRPELHRLATWFTARPPHSLGSITMVHAGGLEPPFPSV